MQKAHRLWLKGILLFAPYSLFDAPDNNRADHQQKDTNPGADRKVQHPADLAMAVHIQHIYRGLTHNPPPSDGAWLFLRLLCTGYILWAAHRRIQAAVPNLVYNSSHSTQSDIFPVSTNSLTICIARFLGIT